MIVLGIHGGVTLNQHEPSAAVCIDGKIVAHCEEERYLRIKSCHGLLPALSIESALQIAGLSIHDIDLVVSPGITYDDFERRIRHHLQSLLGHCPPIRLVHHQEAHVASGFYASSAQRAIGIALDASGDGQSGLVALCDRRTGIKPVSWISNSNSIGYFYSAITSFLGFDDGDEYKVMGLASYGTPNIDLAPIFKVSNSGWEFDSHFLRDDPDPRSPFETKFSARLAQALSMPPRSKSAPLASTHQDLAASAQKAAEDGLTHLIRSTLAAHSGYDTVCLSGGVALNCVANGKLARAGVAKRIEISPVPSDRGLSIGCAFLGAAQLGDQPQPLSNPYGGREFSNESIERELTANGIAFHAIDNPTQYAASRLAAGRIIGWFQGRSESGARALGNRSILADPGTKAMQDQVNKRIKYREQFRPFAPSALAEKSSLYYDVGDQSSPYMSFAFPCFQKALEDCPATCHIDGTARLQTVAQETNPIYHRLITAFSQNTGRHAILNTSFNLKGQPIVDSPRDALMTFFGCGLDELYLGNYLVSKKR